MVFIIHILLHLTYSRNDFFFIHNNFFCTAVTVWTDYPQNLESETFHLVFRNSDFVLKQNRINYNLLDNNVVIDIRNSFRITL